MRFSTHVKSGLLVGLALSVAVLTSCVGGDDVRPDPPPTVIGTEPAPATATTTEIEADNIHDLQIIVSPPAAPCNTGQMSATVVLKVLLSEANVSDGHILVRLVDDELGSDDLLGTATVTIPSGLQAGQLFTIAETFQLRCDVCDVVGPAGSSGDSDPELKVETSSGGDNYGNGAKGAGSGTTAQCAEKEGLLGILFGG